MARLLTNARAANSAAIAFVFLLSACSGGGSNGGMTNANTVPPVTQAPSQSVPMSGSVQRVASSAVDTDSLANDTDREDMRSVLRELDDNITIGSTVPANGEQNPYGLDIAKSDNGKIEPGDLVVCDFNNAANVQGTGSTIIALHPQRGSTPRFITQNASLLGCNALALAPNDTIWAADFSANNNAIVSPIGTVLKVLSGSPFNHPFGEAFAPYDGKNGVAAFYTSNAGDGAIVRINIQSNGTFTFDRIVTGFAVNHGVPGSILGPSGLQYDARHDRLYVVDGTNNTVVALCHVSTIPANGLSVDPNGISFDGPFRHRAFVVFHGAPLNGPISSALLFNGNLVIGNTLDPTGKNLMVEITSRGKLLFVRNVDTGAAGAIFGMIASGTNDDNTKLYFNDDNTNTVQVLTR